MDIRHWIVVRHHKTWNRILGNETLRQLWKGRFFSQVWEKLNGRVPEWSENDLLFEDYFSTAWYVERNHKTWLIWHTNKPITNQSLNRLAVFCLAVLVHYRLKAALSGQLT